MFVVLTDDNPFRVESDASDFAVDTILSQKQEGKWCSIAYFSQSIIIIIIINVYLLVCWVKLRLSMHVGTMTLNTCLSTSRIEYKRKGKEQV